MPSPSPRAVARTVAPVAIVALAATACATRPNSNELAQAIVDSAAGDQLAVSNELAICLADEILNSGLSDTTLSGMAQDFDNPSVLETEANDLDRVISDAVAACR